MPALHRGCARGKALRELKDRVAWRCFRADRLLANKAYFHDGTKTVLSQSGASRLFLSAPKTISTH